MGVSKILLSARNNVLDSFDSSQDENDMLLQALLCGYRPMLGSSELYIAYKRTGLAHLIAVSGAHLTIVFSLIASVLRVLSLRKRITIPVLSCSILSYLVIAGEPVSAMRAVAMAIISMASYFGKRRAYSMNALAISIVAILSMHPFEAISAGFCLSVLSCCGIIVLGPLFSSMLKMTHLGRIPFACDAIAITLAASLASQPCACALFGILPLGACLANVATAPIFPLVCTLGLIYGVFVVVHAPFSGVIHGAAALAAGLLNEIVKALSCIPYMAIPFTMDMAWAIVFSTCGIAIVLLCWNSIDIGRIALVYGLLMLIVLFPYLGLFDPDAITMLDVGQGDAILIRSNHSSVLVDTGENDSMLIRALARNHVCHLDAVVITHHDKDHCGSLDALRSCVQVDNAIVANGMSNCRDTNSQMLMNELFRTCASVPEKSVDDQLHVGEFTCKVVWPKTLHFDGGNEDSLSMEVSHGKDAHLTALLVGDAEAPQLNEMLQSKSNKSFDILKMGHHGSQDAINSAVLELIKPKYALISVGENNRYGHPHAEVLKDLEQANVQVLRTDLRGDISCIMMNESIEIRTQR